MSSSLYLPSSGSFPTARMRRLRMQPYLRDLVAEHRLSAAELIWPVFVQEGHNSRTPIDSMPGVYRLSIDALIEEAKRARTLGVNALALFPVIDASLKTPNGEEALNSDNLVCRAIKSVKQAVPDIAVIADVALDPYTNHGQDGIVEHGIVINDKTVDVLCKQALILAQAGCDMVAPSDMMDGRVGAIRNTLEAALLPDVLILAYSAKYASSFYGPFRDAVGSKSSLGKGDKRNYQMNPTNGDEAMREIALDIIEGADLVMVKPGIAYLDIVRRASEQFDVPVLAYQVSGEYAMIKAAAEKGWIDGNAVMMESLIAFKRAGACAILTYAALDIAEQLA